MSKMMTDLPMPWTGSWDRPYEATTSGDREALADRSERSEDQHQNSGGGSAGSNPAGGT
jgi:hypothetical protein